MMGSSQNWPFIVNLGNSIIGVALLAMPFCFQKCGILLSMLVLLLCTWLTLISCHMLMKAGINSRRRSYEFLAYYTHGATGKFVSEIGMIGLQLGTLIAQIVVIGDLGPAIVTKFFGIESSPGLRTALMILLCLTIGLPMALIKDIRAVSKVSTVCVAFYCSFIFYVVWLSVPNLWSGDWYDNVYFWRPQGLFQCLPILSFSFGCQAQLFLLYDALPEPSLKVMSKVVNSAVNLCAVGYLLVGFCGYVAFYSHDVPGDVIGIFPNTFFTDIMKVCFVFSIVITFPVMIFPCRASIYTLLFAKKSRARDDVIDLDTYIPAKQLKVITTFLVVGSTIIGILIPNVEFILGMNGAIMGTLICYIFPALFYLKVMGSKPVGRNLAHFVLFVGITILLVSTYATLRSHDVSKTHSETLAPEGLKPLNPNTENVLLLKPLDEAKNQHPAVEDEKNAAKQQKNKDKDKVAADVRQEPPNPDPPDGRAKLSNDLKLGEKNNVKRDLIDEGAIDAKESSENEKLAAVNKAKEMELLKKGLKQDELLAELEKQRHEQKILIEEQRQLLKEFKDHHEKDMKQGLHQPLVDDQQNPTPQQLQPDLQPEAIEQQKVGLEQQVVPQRNLHDIPPPGQQQNNSIIHLDNTNQQAKEQQQVVNHINNHNNLVIAPAPQNHSVNQKDQQQAVNQIGLQLIQQQHNLPQPITEQQVIHLPKQLNLSQQQTDLSLKFNKEQRSQQFKEANKDIENMQQPLQDKDLNRRKRDVNLENIVNVANIAQNKENENNSFGIDKPADLTNNKKSDPYTFAPEQAKIIEKMDLKQNDLVNNETAKN